MGRIPDSVVDEVLDKADIEAVVGRYVDFKKRSGANLFGLCPFHSEKTPSFNVNPQRRTYMCFGCHKGGNVINFIQNIESLSYADAIRFLAKQYNINVPDDNNYYEDSAQKRHKDRVKDLLNESAKFFYLKLRDDPEAEPARQYANKRGLDEKTINHFGLGYSPEGWDELKQYLFDKGYTEDEMKDSGLFSVSQKTGKIFPLFRGRLMFPIFDQFGKIIAFGGRNLGPELPKYINSPDSVVYKKQYNLYAYNFAKKTRSKRLIVVEGYMDVIAMHRAGFENTVASLGTAFTDAQLRLCARTQNCEEVVFFFDSDGAGQNAALRAIQMMVKFLRRMSGMSLTIKIAKVPDGKDPDEFIKVNGAEAFKAVVDDAKTMPEYLSQRAYDDNNNDGKLDRTRYMNDICLYGSWLDDPLDRDIIAGDAARKTDTRLEVILNRMEGIASNAREQEAMLEARGLGRKREQEIRERRKYAEEMPPEEQMPPAEDGLVPPPEEPQYESAQENQIPTEEIASPAEIKLFAHAITLNELLTDKKMVDEIDILRPVDFTCENLKKMVREYLDLYVEGKGVMYARFTDVMNKYLLNGRPAEEVISAALNETEKYENSTVLRDMYLAILYKIRLANITEEEKKIISQLSVMSDEEREAANKKLAAIGEYKDKIKLRESKL